MTMSPQSESLTSHLLKNRQDIFNSLALTIFKAVVGQSVGEILHVDGLNEEGPHEAQHFVDVVLGQARLFALTEARQIQKLEDGFSQEEVIDIF